mgnify:CR=1 FL=1
MYDLEVDKHTLQVLEAALEVLETLERLQA